MNQTQLTMNIDAITLYDRSQYIKEDLRTESMKITWAHFYADSEDIRTKNANRVNDSATDTKIIRIPDFTGHFMSAENIIDMLEDALYKHNSAPKAIITTSYMPLGTFCQYLIDNLDCDASTKLNIASIFHRIHNI